MGGLADCISKLHEAKSGLRGIWKFVSGTSGWHAGTGAQRRFGPLRGRSRGACADAVSRRPAGSLCGQGAWLG
jgi:hypothetical protein